MEGAKTRKMRGQGRDGGKVGKQCSGEKMKEKVFVYLHV